MTEPWVFGEPPLDQTRRFADVARRVASLALALEGDSAALAEVIAALERAEPALAAEVPAELRPRVGDRTDGRVYLDHAGDIGSFNPAVPEYAIHVDGDQATGTVMFPLLYEGPPGCVHGGFLAVFFDCVVQHHNCALGQSGHTVSLTLGYRAPAPLLRELQFALQRTVDGRRLRTTGTLSAGDRVCVTCDIETTAIDPAKMPPWSPRCAGG